MDWLRLVLGLITLLSSLITWARSQQLLDQGAQAAIAKALTEQAKKINDANQARSQARTANNATPKSDSLPDDGYRRD